MGAVLVTVWACVHVVAEEVAVGAAHVWVGGGATGPGGTCRYGGSDDIYRGGGNGGAVSAIGATAAVGGAGDVVVSVVGAAASAVCHVAGAMVPAAARNHHAATRSHARRPEAVHRLIAHLCQRVRHHARRVPLVPVLRQGHHVQRDLLARLLPTTHKPRVQHLHEHEAVAVPVQQRVSARERVQQAQVDPAARLRELVDHRQRAHLRPDGCHLRSSGSARARVRAKPTSAACARGVTGSACAVFFDNKILTTARRGPRRAIHTYSRRPTEVERCSAPRSLVCDQDLGPRRVRG